MSIASEITRIQGAKSDLKTSIENKGVTVPSSALIDDYASYVDQIQQGGGSGNPFDGVNLEYLLSTAMQNTSGTGRFLDSLDLLYNADFSNITNQTFSYYAYGVKTTSENAQKIFDIFTKALRNASTIYSTTFSSVFFNLSTTDSDRVITFKPYYNNSNANLTFNRLFAYLGSKNTSGVKMKVDIDFDDINVNSLAFQANDDFHFYSDRAEIRIFNLPLNKIHGRTTIYFGGDGSTLAGAIKEFTFKGDLTAYSSSNYLHDINFRYATGMTLDKFINMFNSLGSNLTGNTVTVTIPSSIYDLLTEDQKAIVTDKGYVLASA